LRLRHCAKSVQANAHPFDFDAVVATSPIAVVGEHERKQTDEAEARRGADLIRTRNAAKNKARKPLGLIDPERLIKALRYLQEHPK
jgi:hypothetical protein